MGEKSNKTCFERIKEKTLKQIVFPLFGLLSWVHISKCNYCMTRIPLAFLRYIELPLQV